jgi:hypothetical protein
MEPSSNPSTPSPTVNSSIIDSFINGYSIKTIYHANQTAPQEDIKFLHPRVSRKVIYHTANKDFVREYCDPFGVISEEGLVAMAYIDKDTNIKYHAVEATLVKRKRIRDKFFGQ